MRGWRWILATVVVALSLATGSPAAADLAADPAGQFTPVYLLMDTSSSMSEQNGPSATRIEAAQQAALAVVDELDDQQKFAMYAYPGGAKQIANCSTARRILPLETVSKQEAAVQIRGITTNGDTPTGPALQGLLDQIVKTDRLSQALVVLVSDGEENCDGLKACDVAKRYAQQGIGLTINTVGLDNSEEGNAELACVADATNGRFFEATSGDIGKRLVEATKPQLALSVDMPSTLSVVTGGSTGGLARVHVSATGAAAAKDVRLHMEVARADGQFGSILVPRPLRYLGNISPDRPEQVIPFEIRPGSRDVGAVTWSVTATYGTKGATTVGGTSEITADFDARSAGPLLATAQHVVVVGDSYSSGEGAGWYEASSTTSTSNCHRSRRGYGPLLSTDAAVVACSGSESKHLRQSRTTVQIEPQGKQTRYVIEPQLVALRELVRGSEPPDLVLMTLGGNDLGFADIARDCALGQYCLGWFETTFEKFDIPRAFGNTMYRAYEDVDSVVNSPEALAKRNGRTANIVVLPYVQLLPDAAVKSDGKTIRFVGTNSCFVGFSASEVWLLDNFLRDLNATLEAEVGRLRASGRPFHFAGPVERAFQPDHTLCERSASYGVFQRFDGSTNKTEDQERLHPTAEGHAAIARTLADWSRQPGVEPLNAPAAPPTDAKLDAFDGLVSNVQLGLIEPGSSSPLCRLIEQGCDGFRPGSVSVVLIRSQPVIVGTATADDRGHIATTVTLPDRLPTGRHVLTVVGLDAAGQPVSRSAALRVWPAGSNVALLVIVVGLSCMGVSGLLVVRGRRRQRGSHRSG